MAESRGFLPGCMTSLCLTAGEVKVPSARFLHCEVTIFPFVIYKLSWGRYFGAMNYHRPEET